ncbi:glycosyltransferase [Breznakiella homolactica]|uniref:Glycosyltransferase n=1 Tax=Breznakiella homolactica TaxID=2798577 RepID=A0A7T7XM53_9SPIR|nr:glycosyltransferase family 2 protein [Breznakiella homolactica]QQO08911.1 glycosyltransferase [Breznakiella homolactica]
MQNIWLYFGDLYFLISIILALYFLILARVNIAEMKRDTRPAEETEGPFVSVLIPVRNEEKNIERCLNSLLDQTYRNYEILVLDDNSTDNSYAIIKKITEENPRVRLFRGDALPDDWYGKPHALQQLSEKAKGEIIVFTDADTLHSRTSVSWAVTNLNSTGADFISGYVGQDLQTFGEKVTVPIMFLLTGFIIPLRCNTYFKSGFFSTAVGQFIAVKKDVLDSCGRFEAVKKRTSEDVYLARHVKNKGYKTKFLDISSQVQCRMYSDYQSAVEGIGKNIFDFLGKNTVLLALIIVAALLFLFMPFPLLIFSLLTAGPFTAQLLMVNILYTMTWGMLFMDRRLNPMYSFLWPLMILNLLFMACLSWFKTVSGQGFAWKGRVVT